MSRDIKELLLNIKQNIKLIEADDYDINRLDEVRSDFLEMMELIKLFMISERDAYYGYFMMNMQFSVNFQSDSIAGIKLNTFPPVFESNPLLLCKFTLKEIIYVTCHEIDHIVLNHPAEMVKANPEEDPEQFFRFNLAADAAVNDRIDNEIKTENHRFMSRPDGVITSRVLGEMFNIHYIKPMENYAYYFDLIKLNNQNKNMPENGSQSMMDEQKGQDKQNSENGGQSQQVSEGDEQNDSEGNGEGNSSEESDSEGNGSSSGDSQGDPDKPQVTTSKNCNSFSDHNWEAGNDAEDAAATVKEFVNVSVGSMNNETRGLMPGWFMSQVELINEPPKLSWQKILKKYVGTISANKVKTRMRLNRRQPERFDLSGSKEDKILKIVVAIDTSGSVDDGMIADILNEILAILAKRKHEITIIECDSKVQDVYKVKTPADLHKKMKGRGGTAFSPVIEYINKNKYYRDALLIYFTDGYGERKIPKPMTYRNIWVLTEGKYLSVSEPYGVVLQLK